VFGDFQSLKSNPDEHRIQPIEPSQLEVALAAAVDTCSHALEPMVLPVAQMQAHLRQCSQDLHSVGTALRA
jgi:hypothetical protein